MSDEEENEEDGITTKVINEEDMENRGRPKEHTGTPPKDGGKSVGEDFYEKERSKKMRKKYLKGHE